MPLGQRVRLWVYTFPVRDGVRILAFAAVTFIITLVVLASLSGCKTCDGPCPHGVIIHPHPR